MYDRYTLLGRPLSKRDIQVLRLLADGFTETQIATKIGITPYGVKACKVRMFGKLGARSSAQAVAIGFRSGYLAVGDIADDVEAARQARVMGYRISLIPPDPDTPS